MMNPSSAGMGLDSPEGSTKIELVCKCNVHDQVGYLLPFSSMLKEDDETLNQILAKGYKSN